MLSRQPWDVLQSLLERIGVADAQGVMDRLRAYTRLMLEWNRGVSNILSRNDEHRFVERHLVESLAPTPALRDCGASKWLDFGSGAGLPAIPLAIAGVGSSWVLVESRRSKTLFIRKTIQIIGLNSISVVNARLENVVTDSGFASGYDGFTSRATLALPPTLTLAAATVRPGGSAFLWKGSGVKSEMDQDQAWRDTWDFMDLTPVGSGPNTVARFTRK